MGNQPTIIWFGCSLPRLIQIKKTQWGRNWISGYYLIPTVLIFHRDIWIGFWQSTSFYHSPPIKYNVIFLYFLKYIILPWIMWHSKFSRTEVIKIYNPPPKDSTRLKLFYIYMYVYIYNVQSDKYKTHIGGFLKL